VALRSREESSFLFFHNKGAKATTTTTTTTTTTATFHYYPLPLLSIDGQGAFEVPSSLAAAKTINSVHQNQSSVVVVVPSKKIKALKIQSQNRWLVSSFPVIHRV
jgi:hypothetical protein